MKLQNLVIKHTRHINSAIDAATVETSDKITSEPFYFPKGKIGNLLS